MNAYATTHTDANPSITAGKSTRSLVRYDTGFCASVNLVRLRFIHAETRA